MAARRFDDVRLGRTEESRDAYRNELILIPDLPPGHASYTRSLRSKAIVLMKLADIDRASNMAEAVPKYAISLETADAILRADPNSKRGRALVRTRRRSD